MVHFGSPQGSGVGGQTAGMSQYSDSGGSWHAKDGTLQVFGLAQKPVQQPHEATLLPLPPEE